MKTLLISKRLRSLAIAFTLMAASLLPLVQVSQASAYGLITSRAITMSSSAVSAASTQYEVSFKPATSSTVKSVAVDFCDNSPIINDTCSATVGTTTPTITAATVTVTGGTTSSGGSNNWDAVNTWTVTKTNSNRTFTMANSTGVALTAGTTYTFTINAITNHTTLGTFYSRILTFPSDASGNYAGGYTGTNVGTVVPTDAGGIALSIASQITVTAKVQERISFCVYTGANCGAGGTAVTLGNTNGVLDTVGPYVDKNAKYDISTNATSGVAIRIKGDTLKNGSTPIAAIGATAAASATGTEQFGFCNYQATGSGLTPVVLYDGTGGTGGGACSTTTQTAGTGSTGGAGTVKFAYDLTNINTTYGQVIANKTAGATSQGIIAFIGNVASTTQAGIYTATLTFIATGTY